LVVSLSHVKKSYQDTLVLQDISFTVQEGELISLIGPSGCGKSTILRCINGLEAIDEGSIQVNSTELKPPHSIGKSEFDMRAQRIRQKVGMVFQNFNLFPHLSIIDNTTKAQMVVQNKSFDEAYETSIRLLDKVGLKDHVEKYPHEMSGGQQQRAAIARALALNPRVLLYDEPTSALDPTLVDEVLMVMKQLDQEGMTQIVVTHEMRFARDAADRVIYLEAGQIVEMAPPGEIFVKPQNEKTKSFLRHFL
jgi:polar amino acid transport system ATP-binding protein